MVSGLFSEHCLFSSEGITGVISDAVRKSFLTIEIEPSAGNAVLSAWSILPQAGISGSDEICRSLRDSRIGFDWEPKRLRWKRECVLKEGCGVNSRCGEKISRAGFNVTRTRILRFQLELLYRVSSESGVAKNISNINIPSHPREE